MVKHEKNQLNKIPDIHLAKYQQIWIDPDKIEKSTMQLEQKSQLTRFFLYKQRWHGRYPQLQVSKIFIEQSRPLNYDLKLCHILPTNDHPHDHNMSLNPQKFLLAWSKSSETAQRTIKSKS